MSWAVVTTISQWVLVWSGLVCLFIYPNGHNMFKETIYVTIQMSMATSCQDNNKHSYQDTILSRYNILLLYLGSVTISLVWGWWISLKVIVITSGKNSNYCNILDGDTMASCTFNYQPHILLDTLPNCSFSIIKGHEDTRWTEYLQ